MVEKKPTIKPWNLGAEKVGREEWGNNHLKLNGAYHHQKSLMVY